MVHITNGDAVAEEIRRWAGEPRLIVWCDALHDGPLPDGVTLEEFTAARVAWLEANGLGEGMKLQERDRQLRRLVARDSVWLWFEDDLYDQLQLLQCLDFLQSEGLTESPHFLVDIPRAVRLEQMAALAANKARVTPAMMETASRAWRAVVRGEHVALLETDLSALPHLRAAMERLADHRVENNRVERTIRELVKDGLKSPHRLFVEYQKTEERPFLGDTFFFWYLKKVLPNPQ